MTANISWRGARGPNHRTSVPRLFHIIAYRPLFFLCEVAVTNPHNLQIFMHAAVVPAAFFSNPRLTSRRRHRGGVMNEVGGCHPLLSRDVPVIFRTSPSPAASIRIDDVASNNAARIAPPQ